MRRRVNAEIFFVFDRSELPRRETLMASLSNALTLDLRPDQRLRAAQISPRFTAAPGLVRTRDDLTRAIERLPPDGAASPIWDALYEASSLLASAPGHRIILLLTDGKATANVHGFDQTLDPVRRTMVTVHSARRKARSYEDARGDPAVRLKRLAAETGGRYAELDEREHSGFFRSIIRDLTESQPARRR